jgi:hypothetical protein
MEVNTDPRVITAKATTVTMEVTMLIQAPMEDTIVVYIKNQRTMSTKQLNSNFWLTKLQIKDMIKKLSVTT